jgi:hypothetical protein
MEVEGSAATLDGVEENEDASNDEAALTPFTFVKGLVWIGLLCSIALSNCIYEESMLNIPFCEIMSAVG